MPDGIFFFAISGIDFMDYKNFLRNLRKGVDKYEKVVYNVGTKEREVNVMEKKTFKVEKGRGKAKVVQFIELTTSDEDVRKLASFAWFGWKIEEVKK